MSAEGGTDPRPWMLNRVERTLGALAASRPDDSVQRFLAEREHHAAWKASLPALQHCISAGFGSTPRCEVVYTKRMSPFLAELVGTLVLVLLGDGIVANVVLKQTKGHNAGWIAITTGWALAAGMGVYTVNAISGAHLNPAVTLGLAAIGKFKAADVPAYLLAQMIGGILGGILVWLAYLPHWKVTEDPAAKLAVFCTAPAIRNTVSNLITEMIGTGVLVFGVLAIASPQNLVPNTGWDKGFAPFLVGLLVWSIGLSLGGPTGYAINPARDLGPRIAHALLPIPGKGGSDWGYAWIPIVGPILGGVLGAFLYNALWSTR